VFVDFAAGSVSGTGRFWLVCTKKGKVKGNESKDGREAKVYLESFDIASDIDLGTWTWGVTAPRNTHRVRCK
jgi:hypothetical protein